MSFERIAEKSTHWIGSTASLIAHSVFFAASFAVVLFGFELDKMLLILTTVVSLEAIYLAIFIQISVNRASQSIKSVETDIDEIQSDIDVIQKDVDEIQEDVEDIQEDDQEEGVKQNEHDKTLDEIKMELANLIKSVEKLSDLGSDKSQNI